MPRPAHALSVLAILASMITFSLTSNVLAQTGGDEPAAAEPAAVEPAAVEPAAAGTAAASRAANDGAREGMNAFSEIWNFPLAEVDGDIVTLGKVVLAIALFIAGIIVSRYLSFLFGRLLGRFGIDQDRALALKTVLFYALLLVFTLYALNRVNVPLTAFTLMGGALAIGVGFGTQTLINNLISGWILITERPVGIGDLVEVEGVVGNIERVGTRSTKIRRPDGIQMLVPNSQMLERTVINWTLGDNQVRTVLRVGVVYGSPTDQVASLIRTIVARNELVLTHPEPVIIFDDFGDNSLVFDVYFWVNVLSEMDLRIAKSDVRFAIDHAFRAAGIVIAFPQRDVHLDASSPIDVRVVEEPPREMTDTERLRLRRSRLGRIELFESLNPSELGELSEALAHVQFEARSDVVRQGETSSSLFVVTQGLLAVVREEDGQSHQIAQLMPGDFFGEMSLLTGEAAAATVTAVTDAAAYKVRAPMLEPILKRRPEVVEMLGHVMAARRKKLDGGPAVRGPDTSVVGELIASMKGFFGLD